MDHSTNTTVPTPNIPLLRKARPIPQPATPIIAPLPGAFTAQPVTPGLAETLARVAYFRLMEHPQADELDTVAYSLLGNVGDAETRRELWEQMQDDLLHLWHLDTGDWTDAQCDELSADDEDREHFSTWRAYMERRRDITAARLSWDIERLVERKRIEAARARREGTSA